MGPRYVDILFPRNCPNVVEDPLAGGEMLTNAMRSSAVQRMSNMWRGL